MDRSRSRQESSNKEEAIPLISLDPKSNKFVINDEAIDFLKSIQDPIAVVGVAGLYRTGKSYLLNRMILNRASGFGVGPTINPCTKGLWIWNRPIDGTTADGHPIKVLVVDSEGIGALDQESSHDSRIFAMTILVSSCFLYNSVGSIDENAIDNLSLVVNLTKNIQIHTKQDDREPDFEDFARYFPSFYWVVRDFTLQLIDSEGEPISSKEYLERSLAPQKGFSDQIENKNRIRRLINAFFPDKDCFTMVRPLTNEEGLQNLEKYEFSQLRPEFVEQMMSLRKQILTKIRPKQIHGQTLDGSMFLGLIQAYIKSINEGSCPTISNAWTYVCQSQCMKAIEESITFYDTKMKENLRDRLPLSIQDLKAVHVEAKQQALANFRQKAVGDEVSPHEEELRRKIKARFQNTKQENESECSRHCNTFILKEFTSISKKLKGNEYRSFYDFEKELRIFYNYFMENGPNGPTKKSIILEFLHKTLNEGAGFFMRKLQQELELQQAITTDLQQNLEEQIQTIKREAVLEQNSLRDRLNELEREKSDLYFKEEHLQKELKKLSIEKSRFEEHTKEEFSKQKEQMQRDLELLKGRFIAAEENEREAERKNFLLQSEFEKEKALFQQKIQYYEKSLEDLTKKEKDLVAELKNHKKDSSNQVKDTVNKYESANRILQNRIKQLEERLSEMENDLSTKEQELQNERRKKSNFDSETTSSLEEAQNTIQALHNELSIAKRQVLKIESDLKHQHELSTSELSNRITQLEEQLHSREENYKTLRGTTDKEKAILKQKIEFLELQLEESKTQIGEIKRAYETTLGLFENQPMTSGSDERQINELKEKHKSEIIRIENEFENIRKRLISQIDQLTERNNELEMKCKLEGSDYGNQLLNMKEELMIKDDQCMKLLDQVKQLESNRLKLLKEADERYATRIRDLETKIELMNEQSHKELQEVQSQAENNLLQLKSVYEDERVHLERRLLEEKERWERKNSNLIEEYDSRLREELQVKEDEIENLREQLHETESRLTGQEQQHEQDLSLKEQTIQTLQKYLHETRDTIQRFQSSNAATLDQHLKSFSEERATMMSKIENLTLEVTKKDKEVFALTQAKEQSEVNAVKRELTFEREKSQLVQEKSVLSDKIEELKSRQQKLHDENLERQVEYARETALLKQQSEFFSKKIEEQQKQIEDLIKRYEDKLNSQKQDFVQELNEKLERARQDRAELEEKYDRVKKSLKEVESTYNGQLSQLEREKAHLQEKMVSIEAKRSEIEKRLASDYQELQSQTSQFKEQAAQEKRSLLSDIEKYKNLYVQLDQDYGDIVANYERDKALWKGKFHFLEQQKDQAKSDLHDAQKKFELTIQQLQKHRNVDKEETESSHNALLASLENRYQNQINEMTESHRQKIYELEEKIKKLDKQLKIANDKKLVENSGKGMSTSFYEKRIADLTETEKRLTAEVEKLRESRDRKSSEYQKMFDKEKEALKEKATEIERRLKECEAKRNNMIFEHEKDRAKWNLERDHLLTQKSESNDLIAKLERKVESLTRDQEKLKNENRSSKRYMTTAVPTANINLSKGSNQNSNKSRPSSPLSTDSTHSNLSTSMPDKLKDLTNFGGIKPYETGKRSVTHLGGLNRSTSDIGDY